MQFRCAGGWAAARGVERSDGVARVVRVWREGSARGVMRVGPGVAPRACG
jgi:hypothetical protein